MKIRLKKLNSRGFAHHLILPVLAIVAVASIGAYEVAHPKAATPSKTIRSSISCTTAITASPTPSRNGSSTYSVNVKNSSKKSSATVRLGISAQTTVEGFLVAEQSATIAPGATTNVSVSAVTPATYPGTTRQTVTITANLWEPTTNYYCPSSQWNL